MALWKPFKGNRAGLDAVEKHDGYVYFCIDDGSLFFDYVDSDGNLQRKQINAKDAETIMGKSLAELQPDWSVNDETSPAYVKNRTHWKGDTVETVVLEETTVEVHEYEQVSTSLYFELGETYTVMFNGELYECVAWGKEGNVVYIGNGSIYGGEGLGGNEPFCFDSSSDNGCYLNVLEDGTYTISISKIVTEIHKLSTEFLPDEVLVKSDWNAAEDELGHIINRTHYIEEVLEGTIPETTVTFGDATIPEYDTGTATGSATQIYPELDEMFVIEWNGVKYYAHVGMYVKTDGSFGRGIGNTGMFGGLVYTEYPFLIGFLTEEEATIAGHTYFVWVNDGSTTATFSVSKVGEAVHRLDAKYLPENIATTEYVDEKTQLENLGIYIGPDEPTDQNIKIWINTSEEGTGVTPLLPRIATITLTADAWTGSSNPWSQVVTVNGVNANSKIDLQPTAQQIISLQNADIALMAENNNGVVTVYALGGKPTTDYTMQVLITEVAYV